MAFIKLAEKNLITFYEDFSSSDKNHLHTNLLQQGKRFFIGSVHSSGFFWRELAYHKKEVERIIGTDTIKGYNQRFCKIEGKIGPESLTIFGYVLIAFQKDTREAKFEVRKPGAPEAAWIGILECGPSDKPGSALTNAAAGLSSGKNIEDFVIRNKRDFSLAFDYELSFEAIRDYDGISDDKVLEDLYNRAGKDFLSQEYLDSIPVRIASMEKEGFYLTITTK